MLLPLTTWSGLGDELVEIGFVPGDLRLLHRCRIGVVGQRSGLAADDAGKARTKPVVALLHRVAGAAIVVECGLSVVLREGRDGRQTTGERQGENPTVHGHSSGNSVSQANACRLEPFRCGSADRGQACIRRQKRHGGRRGGVARFAANRIIGRNDAGEVDEGAFQARGQPPDLPAAGSGADDRRVGAEACRQPETPRRAPCAAAVR